MTGLIFTKREDTFSKLISTLEKHGVDVQRGLDEDSLRNALSLSPSFLIVEFPLWQLSRKDFFDLLSPIWEKEILTIILSRNFRLREADKKPFIHILNPSPEAEERILEILEENLGIDLGLPEDKIGEEEKQSFSEELETGLSHYGVGKLEDAYREWLSILKKDNCNQKAYEYISIARQDFKAAGIDLSEFKKITSLIRDIEDDFTLRGRDIYRFIGDKGKIEELTLHPFEAFVLSLLDGKIPIREIYLLIPEEKHSCLKYAIYHLLQKGLIEKI